METISLIQGTSEWHAHRDIHLNASDAPAMLGCSPYKTRSQLLHEKSTGFSEDVDAATQRRFDDGQKFEALARPLAEKIMGKDLYPVVGVLGKYSASFDGIDMIEEEGLEHKSLNANLKADFDAIEEALQQGIPGDLVGRILADQYRVQMEQQLMVSGAKRILFMASKWKESSAVTHYFIVDADGTKHYYELVEERHCWYYPDLELRAKIVAGWAQFEEDLAAYVPTEAIAPVAAAPQLGLPAVSIVVNGSIALVDNLDKFGVALKAYVERINKKPETDQDFADLEASVKTLKAAEDALDAAESGALAQTESIDAMRKTVALYRETARSNRLLIEKLVKAEKEARRMAIISEAVAELHTHIRKCNDRIGKPYMPAIPGDFAGVVKGLKSLDSMKDKVSTELARCKIAANEAADRIQANLETKGLHGYSFLFADIATLCLKPAEDFQNTVTARITTHEAQEAARLEAEREKIRAEEAAKAQREAAAEASRAEAVRVAAEQMAQAAAAHEANELAFKDAVGAGTGITRTVVTAEQVQVTHVPVANVIPMTRPANTPPTLKLGAINERLGFGVTADFLQSLGFTATSDRNAKLYQEADFPLICAALVNHIQAVQAKQAA